MTGLYRLTPTQEGMLLECLRSGAADLYVEQLVWDMSGAAGGDVHVDTLAEAWRHLTRRHDPLRTSLLWEEVDRPLQVVDADLTPSIDIIDLTSMDRPEREKESSVLAARTRSAGFDLRDPPLWSVLLIRLSRDVVRVVWTFHHAVLDGWSTGLLRDELRRTYRALLDGESSAPPRRRPFADYLAWLGTRPYDDPGVRWWADYLGIRSEACGIPDTVGVPGEGRVIAERAGTVLGPVAVAARRYKVSANTLIQAAWMLTIDRLRGGHDSGDIVVGVTSAGRPPQLDGSFDMVGSFVVTVPLAMRPFAPAEDLGTWLRTIQHNQYAAREYEHVALAEIQRATGLEPGSSLFDTVVVYENQPDPARSNDGLVESTVDYVDANHYPMVLTVGPSEAMIRLTGDATRWDQDALNGILSVFVDRLQTLIGANDEDRVGLDTGPRVQTAQVGGRAAAPPRAGVDLCSCIRQTVEDRPDAPAILDDGDVLSREELWSHVMQLTTRLRSRGVSPGHAVAIELPLGTPLVIGILATLQVGGFWVPVDPTAPAPLRQRLLEDVGPVVVLRSRGAGPQPTVDDGVATPASPLPGTAEAAYVIHTSGSTGEPKGVLVGRHALADLVSSLNDRVDLGQSDTLLALTRPTFDISIYEVLGPLVAGAVLALPPPDAIASPDLLVAAIERLRPTVLQATPSTWRELLDTGVALEQIRALCGGEELPGRLAADLRRRVASLTNLYGPTEATIWSSAHPVGPTPDPRRSTPLGQPLGDCALDVLDHTGDRLPDGVGGELVITGGLAEGYWRQPDATASRFVTRGDRRVLLTGDRARRLPCGEIEFLGRFDRQLKRHGVRIEPGAIEAALSTHPVVRRAHVAARQDGDRLVMVAWAEVGDAAVTEPELRRHLARSLPPSSLPDDICMIALLPRGERGKLDQKALWADLDRGHDQVGGTVRGPAGDASPPTALEADLLRIVCEATGLVALGPADNLFRSGVDSMRALRLVVRATEAGIPITVRDMFEEPSVRGLARRLSASDEERHPDANDPPIGPRDVRGPVPLTTAQDTMLALRSFLPDTRAYLPRMCVDLRGPLDIAALNEAVTALVRRHDALRLRLLPDADSRRVRQLTTDDVDAKVQETDLSSASPTAREATLLRHIERQVMVPFDLWSGEDLFRVHLFRLAVEQHVLVVVADHVACDGLSLGVLHRELWAGYRAVLAGDSLPPRAGPGLLDIAWWRHRRSTGERRARQREFWAEQLSGVPPMQVPGDRHSPLDPMENPGGAVLPLRLSATVVDALRVVARQADTTLYVVLLAALQLVIWADGEDDVVTVSVPVSGRERPELADAVGCFVQGMMVPADVTAARTFADLVRAVGATMRATVEHQDLALEDLAQVREFSVVSGMGTHGVTFEMTDGPGPVEVTDGRGVLRVVPWWPTREEPVDMPPVDVFVNLHSLGGGEFEGEFVYRRNAVVPELARAAAALLIDVLTAVADDPGRSPAHLVAGALRRRS